MASSKSIFDDSKEARPKPEVIRDSKIVLVSEVAQVLFGLAIIAILAHDLSLERFGLWFSVIAIFQIFLFADFGLSTVVARRLHDDRFCNRSLISTARKTQLCVILLLSPISYALLDQIFSISQLNKPPIFLIGISTIALSCTNINRSFLRTMGHASREINISIIDRGLTLLLLLFSRYLIGGTEISYIISFIAGPVVGFLYSYILVNLELPQSIKEHSVFSSKDIIHESLPFAMDSILNPLSESTTRILILFFSGASSVAIFEIAWKVFIGGGAIVRSLRKSMLSAFSANQSLSKELAISFENSTKLVNWLAPLGIFFGSFGAFLIPIVFSEEYHDSILVFLVLLGTWTVMLIGSTFQVAVQSLLPGNRYLLLTGVGTFFQIVLAVVLIKNWGAVGASVSIFFGQTIMVIISIILTRKMTPLSQENMVFLTNLFLTILFISATCIIAPAEYNKEFSLVSICTVLLMIFLTNWNLRIPSILN